MLIDDETWRQLLAPDGAAAASKFQRNFVRAAVARVTGTRPSLMHLTLGQAASVLDYIGESPAKLNAGGRGEAGVEKAGVIAQWTLLGLLLLVVTLSSPAGILLAAGIVGLIFLMRKRRKRRQAWEDEAWSGNSDVPAPAPAPAVSAGVKASGNATPSHLVSFKAATPASRRNHATTPKGEPYCMSLGRPEWPNVEVVGEHAYGEGIRAALRASGALTAQRCEGEVERLQVELVVEPDNPYDSNAISVRWNGRVLGYLSREDAVRYAQPVRRISASGFAAASTARIWAYDEGDQLRARVTVALPEPAMIAPLNEAPTGVNTLLPWGSGIQILKEENHFDVLSRYVPSEGIGLLLVTLHKEIYTLKNGTQRPFVEVRLNGERVGELSNVTSAHLFPLLDHTEAVGETALAYVKITGSALAAQLVLQAAKATEISNDWLVTGPHAAPRLLPTAMEYVVPPAYVR